MLDKRSRSGYCVKCSAVFNQSSPFRGGLPFHAATTQQIMQQSLFPPEPKPKLKTPKPIDDTIWGCDYGSDYFHCWNGAKYLKLKPEDFASLAFAADFDTIVIENAHMQQKRESLAQVFEYEELVKIADIAAARNIEIRLWFHSQTYKWRAKLKMGDKSDEIDAKTIYAIIQDRGLEGLQYFKPRQEYPPRILWAHQQVRDMNNILNMARKNYDDWIYPGMELFYKDARHRSQHNAWKLCGDDNELKRNINNWFFDYPCRDGLSLWFAVVDRNGHLRRDDNNVAPGVKFIMNELLKQKPNHFYGGTARSNIMHHGFRNHAIKHLGTRSEKTKLHEIEGAQHEKWLALRQRFRRGMVITLHAMKKYINEQMTV